LNLKLFSKQHNRIILLHLCGVTAKWWCNSQAVAGDITTQPKQGRQADRQTGRQAVPMSSLSIVICLWACLIKLFTGGPWRKILVMRFLPFSVNKKIVFFCQQEYCIFFLKLRQCLVEI
jgi:hypothetical protein